MSSFAPQVSMPANRLAPSARAGPAFSPARTASPGLHQSSSENETTHRPTPRFTHDFSRISIHAAAPPVIQPKLRVNAPGDEFEREADQVAEQVMRMPEPRLQPGTARRNGTAPAMVPSIVHEVLRSPGQPLDTAARAFKEPRFRHDFSQVRIHVDNHASAAAETVKARAFTVGRDVVFGEGQFAPGTAGGQWLIAHELAHVAQLPASGAVVRRQADGNDALLEQEREIGVVVGEPTSQGPGLTVKIQIVSGSKPAPDHPEEEKIYGGKKGGHVVIDLGEEGVVGFSNDAAKGHVFAHGKKSQNSKFEHYTREEWQKKIKGKQVITYEVEVTLDQRDSIKEAFSGTPEVDYSVLGYRCASYALHALKEAGVIDNSDLAIKYVVAITPGALAKFLKDQGFSLDVQHGSKTRRWEPAPRSTDTLKE